MRFSRRTEWNTEVTPLAKALAERRAAGLPLVDLTASNPTRCGIRFPEDLLVPLQSQEVFDYNPDPRGRLSARQAIAKYYAARGVRVDPAHMVLTTGTSEAYSFLFRLLCDPGDGVLVPAPGYPLFDYLADVECVRLATTPLVYDHGWQLDFSTLESSITERTRAVVLVHPNNPTGHFTSLAQSEQLFQICHRHKLALIVDEVFLDYSLEAAPDSADASSFLARESDVPVFVVSGISKILGLPQMKLAWIAVAGATAATSEAAQENALVSALERLEVLADTFLSVGTPAQVALPHWLAHGETMLAQIRARVTANLSALDAALTAQPARWVTRLRAQAGWYAILRVPAIHADEEAARLLLERGVWVHPGSFFSMPASGWLVVSLLTPQQEFAVGVQVLLETMQQWGQAQ